MNADTAGRNSGDTEQERLHAQLAELQTQLAQTRHRLQMFETLVENATDSIFIYDQQGAILYHNPAALRLHRLPLSETLVGRPISMLTAPEEYARMGSELPAALAASGTWSGDIMLVRPDGSRLMSHQSVVLLADDQGQVIYQASFGHDITAQIAQNQQVQTLAALVENATDGIAVATMDGRITYANPSFRQQMGSGDQTIGMMIPDFNTPVEHEKMLAIFTEMHEQGTWQGYLEYLRADGSAFPGQVASFVLYDQDGQPNGRAAIIRDISEQRQMEDTLRTSEARMRAVIGNVPMILYAFDLEGRFILSEGSGLAKLGLAPGQVVGLSVFEVYRDFPDLLIGIRQAMKGETIRLVTHINAITFDTTYVPLYAADGTLVGVTGIAIDITERLHIEATRIALQDEIIQVQQAALRELSTPLIPIADGIVAMPLIGAIDTIRAQQMMESLLNEIAVQQAEVAIIDITGVRVVDTQVAAALLRMAQAVRMLGAEVVLTGIGAEVAQALVGIGADLGSIVTRSNFQSGIAYALARVDD